MPVQGSHRAVRAAGVRPSRLAETLATARRSGSVARLAGVHDAVSAALATSAGPAGLWLSGLCLSTALGQPDGESVTTDQLVAAATTIRDASDLPLLVDANAGFGDGCQVARLAARLGRLGIDGISIEDKAYPRSNSLTPDAGFRLVPPEVFAEKVVAAKESGGAMLTVARTEALVVGEDLRQALDRAECYVAAGADAIIVHARAAEPVLRFARAWAAPTPLIAIPTAMPQLPVKALAEAGIAAAVFANQAFRAALWSMRAAYAELAEAGRLDDVDVPMLSLDDLFALQGLPDQEEAAERYRRLAGAAVDSARSAHGSRAANE